MNSKKIKAEFKKLVKAADFNSIHDFAINTLSPYTGKSRNSTGINQHFRKAPNDLRVLKAYAQDLNVDVFEIMSIFEIDLENDFNFEEYLKSKEFQDFDECEDTDLRVSLIRLAQDLNFTCSSSRMFFNDSLLILIRAQSTICINRALENIEFFLPIKVESFSLAKKLIK